MADRSKDDDALDDWWEDDLLEDQEEIVSEDDGQPSAEEDLDEEDDLLEADGGVFDGGWDEAAQGEPDEGEELPEDDFLLETEDQSWHKWSEEEEPEDAPEAPSPPPRRFTPPSPLSFVAAVRAPEPLVIGYRVPVDLPEHELRGLAGRCHTHRAVSILRARVLGSGPEGALVRINDREIVLPSANADGSTFAARLSVAGRTLEAKLTLMHSEAPARIYLGRDLLAIGQLIVDVTRADS